MLDRTWDDSATRRGTSGLFSGIYYPPSLPLSGQTPERALLLFDQLFFIRPRAPPVHARLYHPPRRGSDIALIRTFARRVTVGGANQRNHLRDRPRGSGVRAG